MNGLELRIAGVPVRVEPMFFLGMGFLGWVMGRHGLLLVEWLVVAGASILVHEMGHALAFRRFGSDARVVLHGFGGYTTGAGQPPTRSMVVSAAGPGVGLLIGVPVLLLARATDSPPPFVQALLADLIFVNLGWGLFNLLPILPLDGGNLVAAGFERLTNGGGERAARIVSIVASALVAGLALWAGQQFVVLLIGYFGAQNLQALTARREASQRAQIDQARDLMRGGDHRAARETAAVVRETARSAGLVSAAAEVLAWAELAGGRPEAAAAALAGPAGVGTSQLVRTMTAIASGRTPPPLGTALAMCTDDVAATVAAGMVVDAGLLDSALDQLARLPRPQAVQGRRVLQVGLTAAGRDAESARVAALTRSEDG